MLTLLVAVVLGTLFAIFSTQNTGTITLNFGNYMISNVPVYLSVLVPLSLGLLAAYLFYLARHLSQSLTINEQKDKIKDLESELVDVTKTAHKLQVENLKLKKDHGEPKDLNSI